MTERAPSLLAAEDRAIAARVELKEALGASLSWFQPNRLKAEAAIAASQQIDEAKAALRRSANRHPLATWSALTVILALIGYALRRPAAALTRTAIDAVRALRPATLRDRIVRRKKTL